MANRAGQRAKGLHSERMEALPTPKIHPLFKGQKESLGRGIGLPEVIKIIHCAV